MKNTKNVTVFDKILERLEEKLRKSEERYRRYLDDGNLSCMFDRSDIEEKRLDTIKEMLEIVQEVAEEYSNGWIPCDEQMPTKAGKYWVPDNHGHGMEAIFNIYPNTIIHCDTKEKAEKLLTIADAQGWRWRSEDPLLDLIDDTYLNDKTAYYFHLNTFGDKVVEFSSVDYYRSDENPEYPTPISFDEFVSKSEKETQQLPLSM